jgi:hypothetical protein
MIAELASRSIEPRIFVFLSFDSTGLAPARSLGPQIDGRCREQFGPTLRRFFWERAQAAAWENCRNASRLPLKLILSRAAWCWVAAWAMVFH